MRERDGVRWLEVVSSAGPVRFTLAFDGEGERVDLGSGPAPGKGGEVDASRRRVSAALGLDPDWIRVVRQVHGGSIWQLEREPGRETGDYLAPAGDRVEADGMIVRGDREVLAVSTADCLPVAICGPRGRALLHCGWRGLTTPMLEQAAAIVAGKEAIVGPSIGPCCYEVGPEVSEALGIDRTALGTLDLVGLARSRLLKAGVAEVRDAGLCTACEPELLFSYRRQGEAAGRQMTFFSAE